MVHPVYIWRSLYFGSMVPTQSEPTYKFLLILWPVMHFRAWTCPDQSVVYNIRCFLLWLVCYCVTQQQCDLDCRSQPQSVHFRGTLGRRSVAIILQLHCKSSITHVCRTCMAKAEARRSEICAISESESIKPASDKNAKELASDRILFFNKIKVILCNVKLHKKLSKKKYNCY